MLPVLFVSYYILIYYITITITILTIFSELTAENVYLNLFPALAPGPKVISAPPAPALQHWILVKIYYLFFLNL